MHLTVLSNMDTQLFFVAKDLTAQNGLWNQSIRNSALCWEEIEQFHCLEQNVYFQ